MASSFVRIAEEILQPRCCCVSTFLPDMPGASSFVQLPPCSPERKAASHRTFQSVHRIAPILPRECPTVVALTMLNPRSAHINPLALLICSVCVKLAAANTLSPSAETPTPSSPIALSLTAVSRTGDTSGRAGFRRIPRRSGGFRRFC